MSEKRLFQNVRKTAVSECQKNRGRLTEPRLYTPEIFRQRRRLWYSFIMLEKHKLPTQIIQSLYGSDIHSADELRVAVVLYV